MECPCLFTESTGHELMDFFEILKSPIQGLGAFAAQWIPSGTRLIEYAGERLTPAEADVRYPEGTDERHHTYLFAIDCDIVIDAAVNGNNARFINHSCRPNCWVQIVGEVIWIRAARNIRAGEELSYDYNTGGEAGIACRCAPGCKTVI